MSGKHWSEYVQGIVGDLASWFGLGAAVDSLSDLIRGYSERDVRALARAERSRLTKLAQDLQSKYGVRIEKLQDKLADLPTHFGSPIISKAVSTASRGLRDEISDLNRKMNNETAQIEAAQASLESVGYSSREAGSDLRQVEQARANIDNIERRIGK